MGDLRNILPSQKMASMFVVILLAIATTCRGAAIPGQTRMKRKATVWDKSFDFLGLHAGLKYKDAAQPLKGGRLSLTVDDLKKIFPQSHSNWVVLDANFDGGEAVDDGLFTMDITYSIFCADGNGEESGSVVIERKHTGDLWTTLIKTSAAPFSGEPIIPTALSNLEIKVESDRQTKLHAKYVNPIKNRDMHINIDRVPGESLKIDIANGDRKHDLTFKVGDLNFKKMDGIFNIAVEGTSQGDPVKGKVSGSKKGDMQVFQFDLERGNKKFIQFETKLKMTRSGLCIGFCGFEARTKYAVLGGTITGKVLLKFEPGVLSFKNTDSSSNESVELTVKVNPGGRLEIEGKKNEETMWIYKTKHTTRNNNKVFELTLDTEMSLNSNSKVYKFLSEKYPYGAFNTRNNKVKIFVNKKSKNLLAPKLKIEVHLEKDGEQVIDMTADTTSSPYNFKLTAPNFFKRWGINQPSIDITIDHKIGSSLIIDANILGGLHLEGKRGDNAKNGRDVSLLAKKAGVEMFKITWSTEKINNKKEFKFILHDTLDVNPESVLYKNLISKYKILTPFTSRTGEFEFYFNKKSKNVLLNKFYAKGTVMKDGNKALDLLLTTNETPYKFELFAPALLDKVKPGMTEAKISVEHKPDQSLELKTNFEKFTGLKIYKTGSGNERKVELNGKELIMGDYSLTDNSFSTKITLGNDYLEPKITWEGKLPETKQEAEAFMLKNNILVKVTGSKRNLDLNLNWKMTKPDYDFATPENGKISLNAKGNNPRWGDYSLSRDINWKVENKVIEVNWTGLAQFAEGTLATGSPIETSFKFKILLDKTDLIGKFMKKINGKEYSISFPEGSGVMPKIIMGQ